MLKYCIQASDLVRRLRNDKDGVVSFEYIIVAAAIIVVVGVAFSQTGPLSTALSSGISAISAKLIAQLS